MQTQLDCDAIKQANAQLEMRQNSLEDEILDLQNLLNSLYPDDQQRPDLQAKLTQMNRQRDGLIDELRKGEVALRNCLQQNSKG
jgi:outer membrane protein TolC